MHALRWLTIAMTMALVAGPATGEEADDALRARFAASLAPVLPGLEITEIRPSPVPGLYEVMLGAMVLYVSEDGMHVIRGDLYDLADKRNLSEAARERARASLLARVDPAQTINFEPAGETRSTLYVFTDVDCTYCRAMHREIKQLNAAGIAVHYLAYPRTGIGSESYDKAVSVWCAVNRQDAITRSKAGEDLPKASCENPVADQYRLGERLGVDGTPAVMLEDGRQIGGYIQADRLIEMLTGGEG
jgi:thiol:disulfide interchange protein DsbC